MAGVEALVKEGWLHKNHAGSPFSAQHTRRWFSSSGFNVIYYANNDKKTIKGHFDLRNVVALRPSIDKAAGKGAIEMSIAEQGSKRLKVMIIAFKGAAEAERDSWLKLWCSAVQADAVAPPLKGSVDPKLAALIDTHYGGQGALSRRGRTFSFANKKKLRTTEALSVRHSVKAEAIPEEEANAPTPADAAPVAAKPVEPELAPASPPAPRAAPEDQSGFDTPRETPAPTPSSSSASAAEAPPAADEETFEITVPEGVEEGQRLQATTPSGVKVKLVVPPGAKPGMLLTFQVPAKKAATKPESVPSSSPADRPVVDPEAASAAIAIQSTTRGRQTRKSLTPAQKPAGAPPSMEQVNAEAAKAALTVQKVVRGHTVRNSQQEAARLQWMTYYQQPDVCEWQKALDLAVTDEEFAAIREAQRVAASSSGSSAGRGASSVRPEGPAPLPASLSASASEAPMADPAELRRQEWLSHYIKSREFDRAREVAKGAVEEAKVLKATAMSTRVWCSFLRCLPDADTVESERRYKLNAAMDRQEYEIAEVLAISPEEIQYVADERKAAGADVVSSAAAER